ncbi:CYFA0S05e00254g1_1 [Cyberlindnera fabianii]|uniref:CYFA0S05e00254g1_1 n=3 Tax=Cyberlindnera fabianii TaxID=36022 RepID=A0A061AS38_CYBFA|nr:CYFA0S05e00254g1_1 [Cyberlindnera fabianii]
MTVEEVKGFTVIPVSLPQNPYYKAQTQIKHYMFIKKHQSSTLKELAERSLFIVNPPLDTTLNTIRKFFKSVSTNSLIENVLVNQENLDYEINLTRLTSDLYDEEEESDQTLFKIPNYTALVVFVDKAAAGLAMSKLKKYAKCKDADLFRWEGEQTSGSLRFQNMYKKEILSVEETSAAVTQALTEFEEREEESIKKLKEMKEIVDDDGFTLVVGKNRKTKRGILGKISGTTKFETAKTGKKEKKKEKQDFYRFQIREKKKQEMNELLKKFRDDQERIKELKEKKRFRPY